MKRLLYITVTAPLGGPEAFVIPEMRCLARKGIDLTVIPLRPAGPITHLDGRPLLSRTLATGPWSPQVWLAALTWLCRAPARVLGLLFLLLSRGRPGIRAKNLLVFPKALYIAAQAQRLRINHIHAHWASTPSTCAMVAAALAGVDWSFTAHRWDIGDDNLLAQKVSRSRFVRVISSLGYRRVAAVAGAGAHLKLALIPAGVALPEKMPPPRRPGGQPPVITAVGSLTPVKGHRYLLRACRLLVDMGVDFRCLIVGAGPERRKLAEMIVKLGLGEAVTLAGALPHHRVLAMLGAGAAGLLAHPSVETADGAHEGIPVAVMEAMAHGVPVVVTRTGGLPELVDDETGLVVPPADPGALARAIRELLADPVGAEARAVAARRRVSREFNLEKNVSRLLSRMEMHP
ncbi:MAG: glycosyltransferase [Firmicutes bacterium]|nr:glycosyltransferase [Bacillota bacterium]